MKFLALSLGLLVAGCKGGGSEAPAISGDRALDRALQRRSVARVEVGSLPAKNPAAPTKVRTSVGVESGSGGPKADPHVVSVGVYDPASGSIEDAPKDGNALVPVGGAIVAICASGAGIVYFLSDAKDPGGDIEVGGEDGTPVSTPTTTPAGPGAQMTVETGKGSVPATVIAATDAGVCGLAPLTEAHAGPVNVLASQAGAPIGSSPAMAVSNTIQFTPSGVIQSGQTATLVGRFLPYGPGRIEITCDAQAVTLVANGKLTGSAGEWTIVFEGNTEAFSDVPLFSVQGMDKPINAAAFVTRPPK